MPYILRRTYGTICGLTSSSSFAPRQYPRKLGYCSRFVVGWLLRSLLQSVASSSLFHNDPKGGLPAAGDINAGNKGAEVHTAEGCRHTATGGIEEDYRSLVGCHDVAGDLSQRRGAGRGNGGDGGLQTVGDTDRALGGETAAGGGDGDLAGGYGIEYHETGVAVGRLIVDLDAGILGDVDGNFLGRSSGTAEAQMADCALRCLHKATGIRPCT